jgi:hypothetical protein
MATHPYPLDPLHPLQARIYRGFYSLKPLQNPLQCCYGGVTEIRLAVPRLWRSWLFVFLALPHPKSQNAEFTENALENQKSPRERRKCLIFMKNEGKKRNSSC